MNKPTRHLLFIIILLSLLIPIAICTRPQYVYDEYDLLTDTQEQQVDDYLYDVDVQTTCEIVIVIESYTAPYATIFDMALDYFENVPLDGRTGIGKADKDNGVLFIMTMKDGDSYIMTGYGVEGDLTDAECGRILDEVLIPNLNDYKDFDAIMKSSEAIAKELGYEVDEPDPVIQPDNEERELNWRFLIPLIIVLLVLLVLVLPITSEYEDDKWVWVRK